MDSNGLSHTKWNCIYHVTAIFAVKALFQFYIVSTFRLSVLFSKQKIQYRTDEIQCDGDNQPEGAASPFIVFVC